MCLIFIQLRDGSTLSSKRQTGVPLARNVGGRLPGGACVPPLLEGWKHKILLAGKYLNVIRECGIEVSQNQNYPDDEEFSMDDPRCAHKTRAARMLKQPLSSGSTSSLKTHTHMLIIPFLSFFSKTNSLSPGYALSNDSSSCRSPFS